MAFSVIVTKAVAAEDIKSFNRPIVSAGALENGWPVRLNAKSVTAGEPEVWTATAPITGELSSIWMVYDPEIVDTAAKYRGLDPDPRNYRLEIGKIGTAFNLGVSDLVLMSADAFSGAKGGNGYAEVVNATSEWVWVAAPTAGSAALKYIATEYIPFADGSIGNTRITAYLMECIAS
jgi:hypothetical protein